jgi:hypothetical protein
MGEKMTNKIRRNIDDIKTIDMLLSRLGDERDQQADSIAIAVLGIASKITFGHDMFQKETPDPRAEQSVVSHGVGSMA